MVECYQRLSNSGPIERVNGSYTKTGLWFHLPDRKTDLRTFVDKHQLDYNIVRDVLDSHELPRYEFKDGIGYAFIRLPVASLVDDMTTASFLAIIKPNSFITLTPHASFLPRKIEPFLTSSTERSSAVFMALVAYVLLEYERKIHVFEESIAHARRRLRRHEVENADFVEFVKIEASLSEYRSGLEGGLNVMRQLQDNRNKLFNNQDLESLEDIVQHMQQLLVSIDTDTKIIASIQSAYSTIANNTLNQRMKLLTAITILLTIPNVFYSMYGMNIDLPFQDEWWAYPVIFGFTALLILLVFIVAKRLKLF